MEYMYSTQREGGRYEIHVLKGVELSGSQETRRRPCTRNGIHNFFFFITEAKAAQGGNKTNKRKNGGNRCSVSYYVLCLPYHIHTINEHPEYKLLKKLDYNKVILLLLSMQGTTITVIKDTTSRILLITFSQSPYEQRKSCQKSSCIL